MNSLIFADGASINVEYVTDALNDEFGRFTVFQVKGLDDAEVVAGLQFSQLDYDTQAFKDFATDNSLSLIFLNATDGIASSVIGGLNITTASLAAGDTVSPYTELVEADNPYLNPVTFAVTSGTLPDGVTLGSDGQFAGTATETGSFPITITATDTVYGITDSADYTIVIA